MKVAVITTVRHNVGDDFVREGILHLLSEAVPGFEARFIHKHVPLTAVRGFEEFRNYKVAKRLYRWMRPFLGRRDAIHDADLLVQSGAPVYWCHPGGPHCHGNEWFKPLVEDRFLRDRRGRKFFNLAGGSCQRFHSDGSEVKDCPRCQAYIRQFFDACDLTLLRDDVARRMLQAAGRDADVLPCTSIFARDYLQLAPAPGEYIVLNYMENGGHYTFGQAISKEKWERTFQGLHAAARKMGRTVIACHTPEELGHARRLCPEAETFLVPDEHVQYMEFYSRARFGFVNRVHGAFMMASFGKPAFVVGADTRARMIEQLGLQCAYVEEATPELCAQKLESLAAQVKTYPGQMDALRERSRNAYLERLRAAL